MFESLETRRHLSVTAADIHDTLYVWGDSGNNGISVEKSGVHLVVKEYQGAAGYQNIFQVLNSAVNSVRIYGYDGMDTIQVANNVKKPTTIMGGRGADWMQGGGGHNMIWGQGNWNDDPSGSHRPTTDDNAADTFVTGTGPTTMYGQGGSDSFHMNNSAVAGSVYDYVYAGAGNDTIHINGTRGGMLLGESGGDTFKVYNPSTAFNIFGGSHGDTIDFSPLNVQIYATNDPTKDSGAFWGADGERDLTINSDVETLIGTNLRDSLSSTNGAGNLFGRGGNDALYGNGGNDFIDGGDGNDSIWAGNDTDTVFAGAGNDTVWGGSGNDYLFGRDGNDVLYGENGNDQLYGEAGGDHLYGQAGSNKLVGGSDSDYLVSKNGNWSDLVIGGNENGTGNTGAFDIAVVDRIFYQGVFKYDTFIGIESVSF